MAHDFSPFVDPRAFFGSLWNWHFRDTLSRRLSRSDLNAEPAPMEQHTAKMVREHAEASLQESRELLRRADQKRDTLTTLASASLAAIASAWKISDRPPTFCLAIAMLSIVAALIVLLLSRRSCSIPSLSPIDKLIRTAPAGEEWKINVWFAVSVHKLVEAMDVVGTVWAAHTDFAILLLIVGLGMLLPALFGC